MPFYASRYTGTGAEDDPFRPIAAVQAEADGMAWRGIDLRPDCTVATGWSMVWTPSALSTVPANVGLIASSIDGALTLQARNRIGTYLGVTIPAGTTFRQFMRRLLTVEARTDGTRWKPLRAGRLGRLQIALGDYADDFVESDV